MSPSGRNQFSRLKCFVILLSKIFSTFGVKVNCFFLKKSRNIDGKLGFLLRYVFLKNSCAAIGDNVAIFPNVYLINVEKLEIGDNISIHPMCYIDSYGGLTIGNNVSVAHASSIITFDHSWADKGVPIKYNKTLPQLVSIGDDVWIGCGARILSGAVIENRSVVAAGAVVVSRVFSHSVVGGVPSKTVKEM